MRIIIVSIIALPLLLNPSEREDKQTVQALLYADGNPVSIEIENDKITGIKRIHPDADVSELFVAPGLIDVQINGFVGVDFSGPDLTVEGVVKVTRALWKAGVTSYFPT
ncbi:MAG TPA: hypothetical protein VKN36_08060, partial [Eudoraea sp.]|nr:hypothetical protein [Eudoraea sp.]